jgi:tetratricopeptide (TPR) repeat protein
MTCNALTLCLLLTLTSLISKALADEPHAQPQEALVAVNLGDQLYNQGKAQDAAEKYRLALKINGNLEPAQAGLARALLAAQKTDEALATVLAAIAAHPDSPRLLVAMGDIRFRRAEMPEAEQAYQVALQINAQEAKAYVGLAKLYNAFSLQGHAYAALKKAHEIDPKNPEVQLMWTDTLPRPERVAALRDYLAGPHAETPEQRAALEQYLHYLEKTADQAPHSCRVVGQGGSRELKLENVHGENGSMKLYEGATGGNEVFHNSAPPIIGAGLSVKVNGREQLLLFDTGATGIMISRKMAERAKLQRISDISYGGIGDKGERTGYLALADSIAIGSMEFRDCVVTVSDKKISPDIEGLIGADTFGSFMVDIDFPQRVLRLSPLPSRPGDAQAAIVLNSAGIELGGSESDSFQPKDRYVSPEMANWTRFLRFEHMVLVPTKVNGSKPMLFVVDSGSNGNMLSTRAAQSAAKMQPDIYGAVEGVSGRVKDVYRAEKVDLEFGRFHQPGLNTTTIDLTPESHGAGTEISGILGYRELLYQLETKIDYRDGLVDFVYHDRRGVAH